MIRAVTTPWRRAVSEVLAALEAVMYRPGRPPLLAFGIAVLTVAIAWWIYVPVHELLHAVGCLITGGEVAELQIQAIYGGAWLERVVPFVHSGGEYAGRLSGFDPGGSDLVYLATDALPFALTLVGGHALLRRAARRRHAPSFGAGVVLLFAPIVSLTGDYYEMGSILVSRMLVILGPGIDEARAFQMRHDDVFALAGSLSERFPHATWQWAAAVAAAVWVGMLMATATLELSHRVARRLRQPAL